MRKRGDESMVSLVRVGLICALLGAPFVPVSPAAAQSEADELGAGSFLVASRSLLDPNFDRTVVFLLDYNENGALGVIINRPTPVKLGEMVTDMEGVEKRPETVGVGGPVAHWQLVMLIRSATDLEGAERVFEDVYLTASRLVLEEVLESESEFRIYAGYAGWGAGQLENEIDRGSWHVLPGDPEMIFDPAPQELWRELVTRGEAQWASLRSTIRGDG